MSNFRKRAPDREDSGKNTREDVESILDKNGKELVFEDPFGDEFEEEAVEELETEIDIEEGNEEEEIAGVGVDKIALPETDIPTPKKSGAPELTK